MGKDHEIKLWEIGNWRQETGERKRKIIKKEMITKSIAILSEASPKEIQLNP